MSRVGVIGDIHEPFSHPMYSRFCQDVFEVWGVHKVHFIGDIVDNHAISFHDPDPNGYGAYNEAMLARRRIEDWYKLWPKATVSIGNHDERHFRRARKEGIPDLYLRTFADVWGTPKWDWQLFHKYDGVRYQHGTGSSGKDAAVNQAMQRRSSVVQGHTHCWAGVKYHTNDDSIIFGMNVGCGIDVGSYAAAYAKDFANRPTLGCGVVEDGTGFFIPMKCSVGEKYHRSRAPKRRLKGLR
jgi:hypothetical protein